MRLFEKLGLANATVLTGVFPDETGGTLAHLQFAFCHIDVDVYQSAKDVFDWVTPRLSRHGVIVFDDYGFLGCEGITRLVNEVALDTRFFTYYNLNGHAVMLRLI